MKEKIFGFLKKIFNFNYKDYINTSILILFFVITNLINSSLVRFFTVKNYLDIKPVLADLAILLFIGVFAYFFKPKNRFKYFMTWSVFLTAICVIDSMYYTFFMSFSSVSLLATSLQVIDVGDALVKNVVQIKDLTYIWQPIALIVLHHFLKKREYYSKIEKVEKRKKRAFNTFILACAVGAIFIISLSALEIGRLNKQWNREFIVAKFGLYTYHINDAVKSLEPKFNTLFGYDTAYKEFRDYYDTRNTGLSNNEYTNIFEGKNENICRFSRKSKI